MDLIDLISGNADQVSQRLDIGNFCAFPKSFLDSSVRQSKNHKTIERKLRKISIANQPQSLKATAKELEVSVGYLEYRFPALVEKIVTRYRQYSDKEHLAKIYQAQKVALEYFINPESDSVKSRKRAYRKLKLETGLPKRVLLNAKQRTYRAIN